MLKIIYPERRRRIPAAYLIAALFISTVFNLSAQNQKKTSFLQLFGNIRGNNKNLDSVTVTVYENGNVLQTVKAKDNGSFIVVLDLQKNMMVVFSRPGYVSKTIEAKTIVPPDAADIGYAFKCNLDLYPDVGGVSKANPMSKPVAKIAYSLTYDDFDYDPNYSKQIQTEQQEALKQAEDLKKQQDKARLDSVYKAWSDSMAQAKVEAERLAVLEKARKDSIARAQEEELARKRQAEAEKKRQEELAKAAEREKARQDSIARADEEQRKRDEVAREQARQDSIRNVLAEQKRKEEEAKARVADEARRKVMQDSLSKAEAARKKELADSTKRAQVVEQNRKQRESDSLAVAKATEKARQDSVSRAEAEASRIAEYQRQEAEKKRRQDSTAEANRLQREKAEAERQARIQQELKNKREALSKSYSSDSTKKSSTDNTVSASIPKIKESDYLEGITDETVTESNRTIYRTVVKKEGVTSNYQKIVYSWGGVFYFKNESSMSQALFDMELNKVRKSMEKN